MMKLKNLTDSELYERYCKVCSDYKITPPPETTPRDELLKLIITTTPLKGAGIKKLELKKFMDNWNVKRGSGILSKKQYPLNFQKATRHLIDIIAFNKKNVKIMGTMSFKAYKYPSDYDLFETVNVQSMDKLIRDFQNKIKQLLKFNDVFIGDIKAGELEELKIINERSYFKNGRVIGYDFKTTINKLERIFKEGYLTTNEYKKIKKLIKEKPTQKEWNIMLKELRIHIIRMTPQDVLRGYKILNKKKVFLKDTLKSSGLFKLDVIAYINVKFSEFSIIYDLRDNGKHRITNFKVNVNEDLKSNIQQLEDMGKYYKMLKRILSLLRIKYSKKVKPEDKTLIEEEIIYISNVLNGELGIINSVINDIEILQQIIDNENITPLIKIKEQIDNFIYRLSNIYRTTAYLKNETNIIKQINKALEINKKDTLYKQLNKIKQDLQSILNSKAKDKASKYSGLI